MSETQTPQSNQSREQTGKACQKKEGGFMTTAEPFWTIREPDGRLVHTVISCERDDAIKEWVETEEATRFIVNCGRTIRQEKPLPPPTWEEFKEEGYSCVEVWLLPYDADALIGQPPESSHPDEWKPRAKTWHQERLNWQAEVQRLRDALQSAQATESVAQGNPKDSPSPATESVDEQEGKEDLR